jgi:alginate O-acetyltransferase complex protein AlgI
VLFNSYGFIFVFLPVVLAGVWLIGQRRQQWKVVWLLAASCAFYAVWDVRFLTLLIGSVLVNFQFGRWIQQSGGRKQQLVLGVGVVLNVALLGYFKYSGFALEVAQLFGWHTTATVAIVLPLGISFFTFTQIAFLVDLYHRRAPVPTIGQYGLFVTWFPHLVAGPVLHHAQVVPQFRAIGFGEFRPDMVASGVALFTLGLAKKILLADRFAMTADALFAAAESGVQLSFWEAWAAALSYSLQIYFDFSGYSDMAIGLSRILGVELPINFLSPYQATNLRDFWRRWHITLSNFLRDYVYIPLGGSRRGKWPAALGQLLTFLVGGLWHGAGWGFVLWGALHGTAVAVSTLLGIGGKSDPDMPAARGRRILAMLGTCLIVAILWVPFRASHVGIAADMWVSMCGLNGVNLDASWEATLGGLTALLPGLQLVWTEASSTDLIQSPTQLGLLLGGGWLLAWTMPNTMQIMDLVKDADKRWLSFRPNKYWGFLLGWLFLECLLRLTEPSPFLYFQF